MGDGVGRSRRYSSRRLKCFAVATDAIAVALALVVAFAVSRLLRPFDTHRAGVQSLELGVLCLPLWLAIFSRYGLYKPRRVAVRLDEFRSLVHATLACTISMAALSFLLQLTVSRSWLVLCVPAAVGTCLVGREVVRQTSSRLRRSRRLVHRVVVVGSNAEAERLCAMLDDPALGYEVVGVVDDVGIGHLGATSIPILGTTADVLAVVESTDATGVMVATTAVNDMVSNRLVRQLIEAGVHVELSSSLRGISAARLRVRSLGVTPIIYVEPVHRGGWRAGAKRTFDLLGASLSLVVASPLLAVVAVAVKLDTRGGTFFVQERVGKDAAPFRLYKFRTMVAGSESTLPPPTDAVPAGLFKDKDDPRVTRVGRVLRRFSIDELPQLVNVVRGDMSLVGPRPALFSEMAFWTPELMARVRVRPGLTGMWQVSGRSDLTFADYVRHDLYYVENWSLLTDLAIVAKTIPVVLLKRGAY